MFEKGGALDMDALYTVEEMMNHLKVSRDTLYNWMNEGIIPYIQIRGRRRFEASEVSKALKKLRVQKPILNVQNYTLSDVSDPAEHLTSKPLNDLKKLVKRQYKVSKNRKHIKKRQTS